MVEVVEKLSPLVNIAGQKAVFFLIMICLCYDKGHIIDNRHIFSLTLICFYIINSLYNYSLEWFKHRENKQICFSVDAKSISGAE